MGPSGSRSIFVDLYYTLLTLLSFSHNQRLHYLSVSDMLSSKSASSMVLLGDLPQCLEGSRFNLLLARRNWDAKESRCRAPIGPLHEKAQRTWRWEGAMQLFPSMMASPRHFKAPTSSIHFPFPAGGTSCGVISLQYPPPPPP
jgi:hypothetical protein